jgi:hypothetical protein
LHYILEEKFELIATSDADLPAETKNAKAVIFYYF